MYKIIITTILAMTIIMSFVSCMGGGNVDSESGNVTSTSSITNSTMSDMVTSDNITSDNIISDATSGNNSGMIDGVMSSAKNAVSNVMSNANSVF